MFCRPGGRRINFNQSSKVVRAETLVDVLVDPSKEEIIESPGDVVTVV